MNRRSLLLSLGALSLGALALPNLARAAEPQVERDVLFSAPGAAPLKLDIYRPEGPGPHPAVILVHGGGWIGGNKAGYQAEATMLAKNGYVAVPVGYRLAPQYPYPAAFDDCQRAIRWLRAHASRFDINPKRIGAMGASAGGHLVGMLGVRKTRDNSDPELSSYTSRPDAVVSYYGCFDLFKMWDIEMAHKPMNAWLGGGPEGREKLYRDTSPAFLATRKSSPHLLIHGTADKVNPEEQTHIFHKALLKAGAESQLLIIEGAGHGWAPDSAFGKQAEAATLAFLTKHLKRA